MTTERFDAEAPEPTYVYKPMELVDDHGEGLGRFRMTGQVIEPPNSFGTQPEPEPPEGMCRCSHHRTPQEAADCEEALMRMPHQVGERLAISPRELILAAATGHVANDTQSYLTSLNMEELRRLRLVVKQVHMKHYPAHKITDREADRLIESFGPTVKEKLLKLAIDAGYTE